MVTESPDLRLFVSNTDHNMSPWRLQPFPQLLFNLYCHCCCIENTNMNGNVLKADGRFWRSETGSGFWRSDLHELRDHFLLQMFQSTDPVRTSRLVNELVRLGVPHLLSLTLHLFEVLISLLSVLWRGVRAGGVTDKGPCPGTFSAMFQWLHHGGGQQMDARLTHPSLPILHTPRLSSPSPTPQKFLSSP